MQFISTRDSKVSVSFSQAAKECVPQDGGVFVPSPASIEDLRRWIYYIDENTPYSSIAGTLTSAFMGDEFSPIICETIATSAFPFEPVVKQLDDNLFTMELFHGFTGCHRDFGVSYLCSYLETTNQLRGQKSVFLDFTHGELGALLSKVLKGKKNIKAVLVYKKGTIRGLEEEDYIWNGGNILPVEMEGSENDIKDAIRKIFEDKAFVEAHNLTVANTTNICRLMAHIFQFPYSFSRIKNKIDGEIFYSCDAGNYATLMAGLYSWRFALPLSGIYLPATTELTCSPSNEPVLLDSFVDVNKRAGANPVYPANLERLESFFGRNELMMRHFVYPTQVSEKEREKAAKELYMKYKIFADAGTASAYAAVKENSKEILDGDGAVVFISQNHPSLSNDYCRHVIGEVPEMPDNIRKTLHPVILGRDAVPGDKLKTVIEQFISK